MRLALPVTIGVISQIVESVLVESVNPQLAAQIPPLIKFIFDASFLLRLPRRSGSECRCSVLIDHEPHRASPAIVKADIVICP
jgi:hypothetical protein